MTYNVLTGTLNPTHSLTHASGFACAQELIYYRACLIVKTLEISLNSLLCTSRNRDVNFDLMYSFGMECMI